MNRKGATEWGPIYMLIVIVIGAILVVTLLKPTLKQAGQSAEGNLQEARQIANVQSIALPVMQLLQNFKQDNPSKRILIAGLKNV